MQRSGRRLTVGQAVEACPTSEMTLRGRKVAHDRRGSVCNLGGHDGKPLGGGSRLVL
jgi:hypothetical protein